MLSGTVATAAKMAFGVRQILNHCHTLHNELTRKQRNLSPSSRPRTQSPTTLTIFQPFLKQYKALLDVNYKLTCENRKLRGGNSKLTNCQEQTESGQERACCKQSDRVANRKLTRASLLITCCEKKN